MPPKTERRTEATFRTEIYPDLQACPSWIPDPNRPQSDLCLVDTNIGKASLEVAPGETELIKISVSSDQLPPVAITPNLLGKLKISTRSCLAQSGAFLTLPSDLCLSPKQTEALSHAKKINVPALITNYGPSRLKFNLQDRLARIFHINDKDRLGIADTTSFTQMGYVEGVEGVDYVIGAEADGSAFIALRVSPTEYHLPARKTLRISSRPDLYQNLSAGTPGKRQHPFHLVETTAIVNLPDNVLGLLSPELDPPTAIHLPSHLIDPGTSWKIRLEVYGEILPAVTASWVKLTLHHSPLLAHSIKNNQSTYSPELIGIQPLTQTV